MQGLNGVQEFCPTILEREFELRTKSKFPSEQHVPQRAFLDAITAASKLREANFDEEANECSRCDGRFRYRSLNSDPDHDKHNEDCLVSCLHNAVAPGSVAPGLRVLQEAAYKEMRGKVMLATDRVESVTGQHIPPELVELIAEFAMAAEGLPATKKERMALGPPAWCHLA